MKLIEICSNNTIDDHEVNNILIKLTNFCLNDLIFYAKQRYANYS